MKPNNSYSFLEYLPHTWHDAVIHLSSAPQENHRRQSRGELTLHTPPKCQVPESMGSLSKPSHDIFYNHIAEQLLLILERKKLSLRSQSYRAIK